MSTALKLKNKFVKEVFRLLAELNPMNKDLKPNHECPPNELGQANHIKQPYTEIIRYTQRERLQKFSELKVKYLPTGLGI